MIFTIEDQEAVLAQEWITKHKCSIRGKYQGAIGGGITFCFTNTSIGQIQVVKCACGAKHYIDNHL